MIGRREFITLLGGAAAWPVAASAQQSARPIVGFLHSQSSDGFPAPIRGFRQGLKDTGFGDLRNVSSKETNHDNPTIYCFACHHCDGCFGADKRRKCIPR